MPDTTPLAPVTPHAAISAFSYLRAVQADDTGARRDAKAAAHEYAAALTHAPVAAEELRVRTDQIGAAHGTLTPATAEALSLAARCEGVVLDPVYTGQALADCVPPSATGTSAPVRRRS